MRCLYSILIVVGILLLLVGIIIVLDGGETTETVENSNKLDNANRYVKTGGITVVKIK